MLIGIQLQTRAQVLTAQYDNFRSGANLHEKVLKPSNVNVAHFGKLFSRTVDGDLFAQPLYVPSLDIPGVGKRNVIFTATEHDSVYAFDMDGITDTPLWKTSFIDLQHGVTDVCQNEMFSVHSSHLSWELLRPPPSIYLAGPYMCLRGRKRMAHLSKSSTHST